MPLSTNEKSAKLSLNADWTGNYFILKARVL